MKWFKHDSDANMDAKLQELLLDYGLEGYGLYWYCLEIIAQNVCAENTTFVLEHDARVIAKNTCNSVQKVEEMMRKIVTLGLFEGSNGKVTCLKLIKRLDQSMTGNQQMRQIINKSKNTTISECANHDSVMINHDKRCVNHDKVSPEEIRLEENRINTCAFAHFWDVWPLGQRKNKARAENSWKKITKSNPELAQKIIDHVKIRKNADPDWIKDGGKFIPHPSTFLNARRWEDVYLGKKSSDDEDWL